MCAACDQPVQLWVVPTGGAQPERGQPSQVGRGPLRAEVMSPSAPRYVQSLLDIMEFLDKDPEDRHILNK